MTTRYPPPTEHHLVHFALGQQPWGGGNSAHGAEPQIHKLALRLRLIVSPQALLLSVPHRSWLRLDSNDPLVAHDVTWLPGLDYRGFLCNGVQRGQQSGRSHRRGHGRCRWCGRVLLPGGPAPPASVARPALFTGSHRALGPLSYHLPIEAAGVLQHNLLLKSSDDAFRGAGSVTEAHKAVAPGAVGDAIPHQVYPFNNPEAAELALDVLLRCLPGEIGNQQSPLSAACRRLQALVQARTLSPAEAGGTGGWQRGLGHGAVGSGSGNTGVQQRAEIHRVGQRRRGHFVGSRLLGHGPHLGLRLGYLSLGLRGQPLVLLLLGILHLLHVPHQLGKIRRGAQAPHLQAHGPHAHGLRVHSAHAKQCRGSGHHSTVEGWELGGCNLLHSNREPNRLLYVPRHVPHGHTWPGPRPVLGHGKPVHTGVRLQGHPHAHAGVVEAHGAHRAVQGAGAREGELERGEPHARVPLGEHDHRRTLHRDGQIEGGHLLGHRRLRHRGTQRHVQRAPTVSC
mmetsp:Transcript_14546/g.35248  ORF Transcript_14546/g.35248 Transcript_14546/m.35248 type:complete len:509 (+) Transcript_14546:94-1620(+)